MEAAASRRPLNPVEDRMNNRKSTDLQAALKKIDAWQEDSNPDGQRRFRRFPVRGEARLWPGLADGGQNSATSSQIRDISRGGVGLLVSEPVERGQFWQMQIMSGGVAVATLPAFCRFCRKVTDGAYLIGAEFGVEASVLLALDVAAKDVIEGDEIETELGDPRTGGGAGVSGGGGVHGRVGGLVYRLLDVTPGISGRVQGKQGRRSAPVR
jgi:hypothetical protein